MANRLANWFSWSGGALLGLATWLFSDTDSGGSGNAMHINVPSWLPALLALGSWYLGALLPRISARLYRGLKKVKMSKPSI